MKTIVVALFTTCALSAEPFTPSSGEMVVEHLPRGFARHAESLRLEKLSDDRRLQAARELFQNAQLTGDLYSLNLAETLLSRTGERVAGPQQVILQAAILQQKHDFSCALAKLDELLAASPAESEALILKNSILQTLGRYSEARRIFLAHPSLMRDLRGQTMLAVLTSLTGQLESSYQFLHRTLLEPTNATSREHAWAWTSLAEMAVRKGDAASADAHFTRALRFEITDLFLINAYLDHLLQQQRWSHALALIEASPIRSKLKLREAFALKGAKRLPELRAMLPALQEELESSSLHQRERALFHLNFSVGSAKTLNLALENWELQKEPIDARLVLETALAANNPNSANSVLAWLKESKLEDVRLLPLIKKLEAL